MDRGLYRGGAHLIKSVRDLKHHLGHSGQNGTVRYILTDFQEIFKISKYVNCMPRTHTYDQLTSTNVFSHLPLGNLVLFFISLIIKCQNVMF